MAEPSLAHFMPHFAEPAAAEMYLNSIFEPTGRQSAFIFTSTPKPCQKNQDIYTCDVLVSDYPLFTGSNNTKTYRVKIEHKLPKTQPTELPSKADPFGPEVISIELLSQTKI